MQKIEPFAGQNILITGAQGFVGTNAIDWFAGKGCNVVGVTLDSKSNLSQEHHKKNVSTVFADVSDSLRMQRVISEYEIDFVLHLAAQSLVGPAKSSPFSTFQTNVLGTVSVLEACRVVGGVKGIVVASSDKAYGEHDQLPYKEESELNAIFPYDTSKACADLVARSFAHTYGLPVVISRFANIFGEGDLNFSRIIPHTIRQYILNAAPQLRSSGNFIRDFIYVKDVLRAYELLLANASDYSGRAFNFSYELKFTVLEVVNKIQKIMGSSIEPKILNNCQNEIKSQYLCSDRAKTELGWLPLYDFESGLKNTVEWYRAFLSSDAGCKSDL